MGLSQALSAALAGVNTTQQSLSVIAGNVANANTPGYVDEKVSQIATTTAGRSGVERRYDRHQSQSQYAAAEPIVDGDFRRDLCGHDRPALSAASANLRHAGLVELVQRDLQQFHHGAAIALEQSRCIFGANPGGRRRAGARAKSQFDDHDSPATAHAGGAGHRQRRANRQHRAAADRPNQPEARKRRRRTARRRR